MQSGAIRVEVDRTGSIAVAVGDMELFVSGDRELAFWILRGRFLCEVVVGIA